jgi:uncharacterized membrane protein
MLQILSCGLVAAFWSAGILLGRASGLDPMTGGTFACLGTGVVGLAMLPFVNYATLGSRAGVMGSGGGISNGLGLALLFALLSMAAVRPGWEISKIVPTSYTGVVVLVALGAALFFAESLTAWKMICILVILAGMWGLTLK